MAWRDRHLEWDGQILIMPYSEHRLSSVWDWAGEFYKFAAIICIVGILAAVVIVWLVQNPLSYQSIITELQKGFGVNAPEPGAEQ